MFLCMRSSGKQESEAHDGRHMWGGRAGSVAARLHPSVQKLASSNLEGLGPRSDQSRETKSRCLCGHEAETMCRVSLSINDATAR